MLRAFLGEAQPSSIFFLHHTTTSDLLSIRTSEAIASDSTIPVVSLSFHEP